MEVGGEDVQVDLFAVVVAVEGPGDGGVEAGEGGGGGDGAVEVGECVAGEGEWVG